MTTPPPVTTSPTTRPRRLLGGHVFLLVPFLFYFYTAAPTIGLGDTALLLDGIEQLKINTHVNNHNLSIIVGWLFTHLPVGDLPYRGNLSSACLGALAVALFYLLAYRTCGSRWSAALSALLLMISHSVWWHSTIVECYAWNGLFTVLALHLLLSIRRAGTGGAEPAADPQATARRPSLPGWRRLEPAERSLALLFGVAGLALFNHVQMGIIALGATVILLWRMSLHLRRWRDGGGVRALRVAITCTLCFLVGFLPYLLTFVRDARYLGSFSLALQQATVGSFQSIMFKGTLLHGLGDLSYLIFKQFPSPALVLVAIGIVLLVRDWRRSVALTGLAVMLVANLGFFMFYNTWDKFAFMLPSFVLLAYAGVFGVDALLGRMRRPGASSRLRFTGALLLLASLVAPVYIYAKLSVWGGEPGIWHARYNNDYTRNTHDAAGYIANPNKRHYTDIADFAELLFTRLPEGADYIDDDSRTYYPIDYLQTRTGRRPDLQVHIINSWGFSNWGLSAARFATLLRHSYQNDLELYLVTVDQPFTRFIAETGVPYRFARFDLDAERWIYRLETRSDRGEAEPVAPYRPFAPVLRTGVRFNTTRPETKALFGDDEAVMTALDFEINSATFPIHFRWLTPDGTLYWESEPFIVPLGNTRIWSFLERDPPHAAGRWQVEAFADSDRLATSEFVIRARDDHDGR